MCQRSLNAWEQSGRWWHAWSRPRTEENVRLWYRCNSFLLDSRRDHQKNVPYSPATPWKCLGDCFKTWVGGVSGIPFIDSIFFLSLSLPKLVNQCLHSLMFMSNPEELRSAARWSGMGKESRKELMDRLQHFLPPSIMLPPHRYIYYTLYHASQLSFYYCIIMTLEHCWIYLMLAICASDWRLWSYRQWSSRRLSVHTTTPALTLRFVTPDKSKV